MSTKDLTFNWRFPGQNRSRRLKPFFSIVGRSKEYSYIGETKFFFQKECGAPARERINFFAEIIN